MKVLRFVLFFLVAGTSWLYGQTSPPFWNEIRDFKQQDSIQHPPANAILFVGSSSFRLWSDVQESFSGYTIINRGFGGSTLSDVIRYAEEIVFPYQPRQIVIYCGENDLAASDTVTAEMVSERFKTLFNLIRAKLKKAEIIYVSIKPSPSRSKLMPAMVKANDQIAAFLKTKKKTTFVNIYNEMLAPDGLPRKELFIEDNLHMNAQGYELWKQALLPYLIK